MTEPKTIKGYLSLMSKIDKIIPRDMKGHDDLPQEIKDSIKELDASISNLLTEIKLNEHGKSIQTDD